MPRQSLVHYIAPTAISITPNCNGTASDLAVYLARDTKIRVNSDNADIGIDTFTGTSNTGAGIKALTKVSGYYVKRNDGVFFQEPTHTGEGGDYMVNVYHYNNGKQDGIAQHTFNS